MNDFLTYNHLYPELGFFRTLHFCPINLTFSRRLKNVIVPATIVQDRQLPIFVNVLLTMPEHFGFNY